MKILAPAGSFSSFLAAIKSGADAVYLGLKEFSARASAENFSLEELKLVSALANYHNIDIYLTINTLLDDNDISKVKELLKEALLFSIKGVILQDLAFLSFLKQYSNLEIVASTQASVCNSSGVNFMENIGYTQVVLARELSLTDLQIIKNTSNIKLEIFGHGAMCYSMSGQCLISSLIGGRSGNMGRCAQICRKKFKFGKEQKSFLSMNDLRTDELLMKFEEIGIDTVKIEGRMRTPEYVFTTVKRYNSILKGKNTINQEEYNKSKQLNEISFNRGFSSGYFNGYNKNLINKENQADHGLLIGIVEEKDNEKAVIKLYDNITTIPRAGDGISVKINNKFFGFTLKETPENFENKLNIFENINQFKHGCEVYLNYSKSTTDELDLIKYKIPLTISISINKDNLIVNVLDQNISFLLQKSENENSNLKTLFTKKLTNFKHDLFEVETLNISDLDGYFLPYSKLRNRLTEFLNIEFQKISLNYNLKIKKETSSIYKRDLKKQISNQKSFVFQIESLNQKKLISKFFESKSVKIRFTSRLGILSNDLNSQVLPPFIKDINYDELNKNTKTKDELWVSNIGEMNHFQNTEKVNLTYNFNIKNSQSFNYLSKYANKIMLSVETDLTSFSFDKINTNKATLFVAGYLPVMTNLNCLFRDNYNCKDSSVKINNCSYQSNDNYLTDEKGAKYHFRNNIFHQTEIIFHKPLFPLKLVDRLRKLPFKDYFVNCEYFSDEELYELLNFLETALINGKNFHANLLKDYFGAYKL